jgi:hypothetical protein
MYIYVHSVCVCLCVSVCVCVCEFVMRRRFARTLFCAVLLDFASLDFLSVAPPPLFLFCACTFFYCMYFGLCVCNSLLKIQQSMLGVPHARRSDSNDLFIIIIIIGGSSRRSRSSK